MDKVSKIRKIALAAERSSEEAQNASDQTDQSPVGQAISTANTALEVHGKVMGAYGTVMGATGAVAEKAMVAVFSKLAFMQGIACLPASSQLDPVVGIDVHLVMIPPSPSPIPMPHPYVAMVFNPKDFIACAVMSVTATIPPPPPDSKGKQLASTVGKMALGMVMAKMGLGASVKLGGFTPRTVTGTANKAVPHFPMGASFAPIPILKNSGHAQFGSLFLLADGEPFTGLMHLNNDCWDVGVMQLMRKKAPPQAMHLFMPTGFVMAIPSHNVIVNPVPTPINPIAALTKVFNFGLAKILHKIVSKLPPGLRNGLHKAVCHVTGHPVDVVSGMLFTDEEDFSLPGVITLSWERTWYSDSTYKGPLGHGWYHNYDMGLAIDTNNNQAIYRMNDGRGVLFELPLPGKFTFDRKEKLFLHCHSEEKFYYIEDRDGLLYRFTDKYYKDQFSKTGCRLLKSISNRNGYAIRFEYNYDGCLTKIIDSADRVFAIENDHKGRIMKIIAPHPSELNKTFIIANYAYDEEGNMVSHSDALGQQMQFDYENYLLVKETWRNGHQWYFEYDGKTTGAKCIHTWGDGNIYNHKLTYTEGCTVVENSLGYTTTYYHKNGLPYIKIDGNGAEWKYRYNRFNELEWETDPLGNQHNYSHDEWGNIVTEIDPCGGFENTEYYNLKFPLFPTEVMDKAGGKWKWEYDERGNLITVVNSLGARTHFKYKLGLISEILNCAGAVTKLKYDKQNNLVAIETDDGAFTEYLYDALGNCIRIINPNGIKQKREYDLNCRVERIKEFDGNIIELKYDEIDNLLQYKDMQKDVQFSYNGLMTVTSRTEGGATIYYKYDTEERPRSIVNENGELYYFELDAVGNMKEEISFDNTKKLYERNAAGWVMQVQRANGKYTKFNYDSCGRVIRVDYSDGKTEIYCYCNSGELIDVVNESATIHFERDVMGNILKEKINDEWIGSEYDILNNRVKINSSLGANISQQYNKMNKVQQRDVNGWIAHYMHDKLGLEIERLLPGGIVNRHQRDGIGRLIVQSIEHKKIGIKNSLTQRKYTWGFNDILLEIKDEKGLTRFIYDDWNNLTKTIFPKGEEQLRNPDTVGNLFKTLDRKDRIYSKGGQLKKSNGWIYSYDVEGNLTERRHVGGNIWKYEWNEANMLVKIVKPDKTEVSFGYDAFGRRIWKHYKNTTTKYLWNGNELLHEWKEFNELKYIQNNSMVDKKGIITWGFDINSYTPCCKLKDGKKYTIISDHVGTPNYMYKDDGTLFWHCELDSYGEKRLEFGDLGSCPFRYLGQYEDSETGLYYNRFRYYLSNEGVYISKDPLSFVGGLNLYAYVNDPNFYVDVFGLVAAPASLPNEPGVYVITNGNDCYVGSSGIGQQGMNDRISSSEHKSAQSLLSRPGTTVEYRTVHMGTATSASDRNNILRQYENHVYQQEVAKGRNMLNTAPIQSKDKKKTTRALIRKFGARLRRRRTCK